MGALTHRFASKRVQRACSAVIALLLAGGSNCATAQLASPLSPAAPATLEGYPTEIAQSLLQRKLAEEEAIRNTPAPALFSLVATNFLWPSGTKLIVAFQGGRYEIWKDIASIAAQWSSIANITFDFGIDPVARTARTYRPGDPPSSAHVRINLTNTLTTLRWSSVGRQALLPEFNQDTMSLGGIAQTYPFWTDEDRADVLHEFGHVLGFLHEQQRADCTSDYRLERGPNGEPTIFDIYWTVYRAAHDWTRANLLLSNTFKGDGSGKPDKQSLFLYPTPDAILPGTLSGSKSPCYVRRKNLRISAEDVKRARRDYPFQPGNSFGSFAASNIEPLKNLTAAGGLSASPPLADKMERLELASRPLVYIQVGRSDQRDTGERLRDTLLQNRYVAPAIENIARNAKPPAAAEVRYFSPADASSASAVARLVAGELGTEGIPIRLIPKETTRKLPLEVWLPTVK